MLLRIGLRIFLYGAESYFFWGFIGVAGGIFPAVQTSRMEGAHHKKTALVLCQGCFAA
jgi:hypothetical protein